MIEVFGNGEDIHAITARGLTGGEEAAREDRRLDEAVDFGLLHGM